MGDRSSGSDRAEDGDNQRQVLRTSRSIPKLVTDVAQDVKQRSRLTGDLPIGSFVSHIASNAMFVRGVTRGPDRLRQFLQPRPGDFDLPGIKRDDRGADELEQLSARRPACYIATRTRFAAILLRCPGPALLPPNPRFLARNYSPTRSCTLLRHHRTRVERAGHLAADDVGRPKEVAEVLRAFFSNGPMLPQR
jgi:hypothetical protein